MNNWYQTQDDQRRVRQIVAELPSGGSRDSEFANLGLAAKYQMLMTQKWVAGYFRTDTKKGPYLLVRADGHVQGLRDCPLRIAFTFYREPSAGLFGIFVAADSTPELQRASPTGHAVFECIYGLDDSDTVERIREGLSRDVVHLCFADKSSMMSMEQMDANGNVIEMSPPCCRFDRVVQVSEDCRQALAQQFKELLHYHRSTRRDYQRAVQEVSGHFPAREHPVLARSDAPKSQSSPQPQPKAAATPQPQQKTQEKKWWEFWK